LLKQPGSSEFGQNKVFLYLTAWKQLVNFKRILYICKHVYHTPQ